MPSRSSRTIAAAFAALLLAAPAAAQDTQGNATVGAPELRGFRLPGTRVVPAPTTQPPAPTPDPPAATEPARQTPAPATRTTAAPQPQREAPRTAVPAATGPAPARSPAAAPSAGTAPSGAPPISLDAFPTAGTVPTQDYSGAPAAAPVLPAVEESEEFAFGTMIWPALAAGLALLAGLFFMQRRRRAALAGDGAALERATLTQTPQPPAPAPMPVRKPILVKEEEEDEALQPVLDLEFKPDRMVATDKQAIVHFKLAAVNAGKGPARNVRVEARMFSASAQQNQEIAAFLATPCEMEAAPLTIAPGQGFDTAGAVMLDKQDARAILIDGRPLFIPTVVVRIVYQWGKGRSSQVHSSYVVGIESQKSPDKMGPFRLDMGPRIYRSVGGRKIEPARARAR